MKLFKSFLAIGVVSLSSLAIAQTGPQNMSNNEQPPQMQTQQSQPKYQKTPQSEQPNAVQNQRSVEPKNPTGGPEEPMSQKEVLNQFSEAASQSTPLEINEVLTLKSVNNDDKNLNFDYLIVERDSVNPQEDVDTINNTFNKNVICQQSVFQQFKSANMDVDVNYSFKNEGGEEKIAKTVSILEDC